MTALVICLAALFGAAWRRWFGGWGRTQPRILKLLVGGILAGSIAAFFQLDRWEIIVAAIVLVPVIFVLGHGSYMDGGTMRRADNEFLKPVLDVLFGTEPPDSYVDPDLRELRDTVGMSLRYGIFTAVYGAAMIWYLESWMPLIFVASGFLVGLAYFLAWRWDRKSPIPYVPYIGLDGATSVGELAMGALIFGGFAIAFV